LFSIQRDFVNLTLDANGKADLYFHAYFWHMFATNLFAKGHHLKDQVITPESYDQ